MSLRRWGEGSCEMETSTSAREERKEERKEGDSRPRPKSYPTPSFSEITSSQKKSLLQTIQEANANELKRLEMMRNATSQHRLQELSQRYEKERVLDQQRISNLVNDLKCLQSLRENEQNVIVKRSEFNHTTHPSSSLPSLPVLNSERMPADSLHNFYKENYQKTISIDRKAANRRVDRFDEYAEKKKVYLFLPPVALTFPFTSFLCS
jgi:hypothetical protein